MEKCRAGEISSPAGKVLSFGKGSPVLYVNDRVGYAVETPEMIARLQEGGLDGLMAVVKQGLELGCPVVNLQMMRREFSEEALLPRLVERVAEETAALVALDTRNPALLETCLRLYGPGKALCNVVNGEAENLRTMMPVIAKYGGAVGTALVDEKGIPDTLPARLAVARRIVQAAAANGIPPEDVAIDGTTLPAGLCPGSVQLSFETMRAVSEELGAALLLGVSNIGYMMPVPPLLEMVYCVLAAGQGLGVAMVDPAMPGFGSVKGMVDFLTGRDPYGEEFLAHYRNHREELEQFLKK